MRSLVSSAVAAAICLAVCAAPCPAQQRAAQPLPAAVAGRVLDPTGLPLASAVVTLERADGTLVQERRTGSDGSFAFAPLADDALFISVRHLGFVTTREAVPGTAARAWLSIVLPLAAFGDTVTVTATRGERALADIPASVGVISGRVLDDAPGVNLAESLQYVPGVVAGDVSGVDDLRISIRGAGVRAGFGSRGVLLMADGYPVTEPDGQTPHFDGQIDLSNAERVEVVKGPSSALYGGAALGGIVNVITRRPGPDLRATGGVEAGSFNFAKARGALSGQTGSVLLSGTINFTHLDGFRAHNSLRNWMGTLRGDWAGTSTRVNVSVLGTDARLELPGTLSRAEFESDPSQVRDVYVTNDWGRHNKLWRFGGAYERQFPGSQSIELSAYGQTRDLFHPIFVVIDQQVWRQTGRARYRLARGRHTLAVGVDADTQWVDDRWFVNAGGNPAFQIRDDDNTVTNVGVYVQDEIVLGGGATIVAGVRADNIRYALRDRLPGDGDASDRRTFRRVSPKLGITAAVAPQAVVYANVATGFEAPTLGEVRLPSGFNGEVRPQRALSLDGGVRGGFGRLAYDVAVYRMLVDDEILPETIDNVTYYRNVAAATHTGLEVSTQVRTTRWLTLSATYAYQRFTLDDFGVFSGNRLPGIPPHTGTVRASVAGVGGWDGFLSLVAASSAFVNDANNESATRYGVLSGGVGYSIGPLRFHVRTDNLTDARYTNRAQVNDASGFYYYPAPGRQGTAGVEVRW